LTRSKSHNSARTDWNLFACFWIAAGPLIFVAKIKITETGKLHLLAARQGGAHFFEEKINELPRLSLVEAQLVE
jgi:hypothetical protein